MSNTDLTQKKTGGELRSSRRMINVRLQTFSNDFVYYEVQDQNVLIM
jgi:hypothetical protein